MFPTEQILINMSRINIARWFTGRMRNILKYLKSKKTSVLTTIIFFPILLTSCGYFNVENPDVFKKTRGTTFFSTVYENIWVYHRNEPNILEIMLSGLNGLSNIDNGIDNEVYGDEVSVKFNDRVITTLLLPKPNDFSSWAQITVQAILELQNVSRALEQKDMNVIYKVFLENAFNKLDKYSKYFPPKTGDKSNKHGGNIDNSSLKQPIKSYVSMRKNIIVIRLNSFLKGTVELVNNRLKFLQTNVKPGARGIIIDLRDNRGGRLDEAVGTADLFISEGTILKTQGRHLDANQHYIASPVDNEIPTPLIILINETTASAAEVLAAAIGEHDKGLIIGIPTYGKGSVQLVRYLPNEGQFNLTWKELFSPYGFSLSEFGVLPKICTKDIQPNTQDNLKVLNKSVISKRHKHQDRFINQSRKQQEKNINPRLECKKSAKKDNPNGDYELQLAIDILTSQTLYKRLINHSTMIKF